MRTITTRADLFGPSAGLSYSLPNAPQSAGPSASQPISTIQLFGNLKSSFLAAPITWLGATVLVLIGWKLLEESRGEHEGFEEVKIGISNWFKIGVMMILFFAVARFISTKYDLLGASKLVNYATGG